MDSPGLKNQGSSRDLLERRTIRASAEVLIADDLETFLSNERGNHTSNGVALTLRTELTLKSLPALP